MNDAYELTDVLFETTGLVKQLFFQSLKGNNLTED